MRLMQVCVLRSFVFQWGQFCLKELELDGQKLLATLRWHVNQGKPLQD